MRVWPGQPYPLGATWTGLGVNFAIFSAYATRVELCLFDSIDASAPSESDITSFLDAEEPAKTNGTSSKSSKKADKKEEKPKAASNGPPLGDDQFDFNDILKSL